MELLTEWEERCKGLAYLNDELTAVSRYKKVSGGLGEMRRLPAEAFKVVVQFLPIYHGEWRAVLELVIRLLDCQGGYDVDVLRAGGSRLPEILRVRDSLEAHKGRFGLFSVYLASFGLPRETHVEEREAIRELIRLAVIKAKMQIDRWKFIESWSAFNKTIMETTCYELAKNIKPRVKHMTDLVRKFAKEWPGDQAAETVSAELSFISSRVHLIGNLGAESVTKSDCKHMFLQLNMPFDETVSDDYPRSISFRQAVTLGLFNTSRLRGFIWEDKLGYSDDKEKEEQAERARQRDAEEERRETIRRERAQVAARKAAEVEEVLTRVRESVHTQMAQRLWTETDRAAYSYEHQWAGCEICTDPHVAWAAIPPSPAAPNSPLLLCSLCISEYTTRPVIHRSYIWFWISYLLTPSVFAECPSIPSLAKAQQEYAAAHQGEVLPPHPPDTPFNDRLIEEAFREEEEAARVREEEGCLSCPPTP